MVSLSFCIQSPEPQEANFEEQETGSGEEATPMSNISSSSPDEAVMPSPPSLADYFNLFQDLTRRLADTLQIPLEEVKETPPQATRHILHTTSSSRIALPVNKVLLEPAKVIWHTPASIVPTWKKGTIKSTKCPPRMWNSFFHTLHPNPSL